MITKEFVRSIFEYKDGKLYRKVSRNKKFKIGSLASSFNKTHQRYLIKVDGKMYKVSQVVFLWHHGYIPDLIDHIDRDKLNDKIENLREATKYQNNCNKTSAKKSTSKYLGVCWDKKSNKWVATICKNRKITYLGSHNTEEEAALAYNIAASKIHKEFSNLNLI